MLSKAERDKRDEALRTQYQAGKKVFELAQEFGISLQRVRQILERDQVAMRDDRNVQGLDDFLGVNISSADKKTLRLRAEEVGQTTASLTRQWIKEKLGIKEKLAS